jgi:hypothetical protein
MRGVQTLQSTVWIPASARTASNAAVKFDLGSPALSGQLN